MILIFVVSIELNISNDDIDSFELVTTGWLNWPLEKIQFWSRCESFIEYYSGAKPRSDDFAWAQKIEKFHDE